MLYFVGHALVKQWRDYRHATVHIEMRWGYILASGVVVVATYAVLIETWRRILSAWSAKIRFADAMRIWFVSNLATYIPGKLWQIVAMGKLAEGVQVPPAAAASSSIVNVAVNIAVGLAVGVIAGYRGVSAAFQGHSSLALALTVAALAGILALPVLMPHVTSVARRTTGRNIDLGPLPPRAVYIAIAGNIVAWIMYGWAFQLLVAGVLGSAPGRLTDYIAAFSLSYVIGYLVFFMPAGVGAREVAQSTALTALVAIDAKNAFVLAVVSRLWLTVLQVVPGLFFLARTTRIRPKSPPPIPRDGSNLSS